MFTLKRVISRDTNTHPDDTSVIKSALTALGYYDDSETGLSPYPDDQLFKSINSFQKDNELKVDGVIKPDGPTQAKIKERLSQDKLAESALQIFMRNRKDMMDADTIGADKYFHCVANYEATQQGWEGEAQATLLSGYRELYGNVIKGDPINDMKEDLKANRYGRDASKSGKYRSAQEACAIYRPKGLDDRY